MIRAVVAGLGYFSGFHLDAWAAHPQAALAGVCDVDAARAAQVGAQRGVPHGPDLPALLDAAEAQVVDIVAPPPAHAGLIRAALAPGRLILCQKPFCTSIGEAQALIAEAGAAGARIVIHENFRFQPWYRDIKDLLDSGQLGQVWSARFALRPGDGRGPDAYLARQPGFQTMPRLLVHETAVHFIDLFRWLLGDITAIYADLRRLNPAIAGEDAGLVLMDHAGGAQSTFDGNRLTDQVAQDPRRTMGTFELIAEGGTLSMDGNGRVTLRRFGSTQPQTIPGRPIDPASFGGGCVAALIAHVIDHLQGRGALENQARDYLPVMQACEAAYLSAHTGAKVRLDTP